MKKLLVTKDGTFEIDLTSEEIEERKQASKKFEEHKLVEAEKDKLPAGDYVVGGRIITIGEDGIAKAFVY